MKSRPRERIGDGRIETRDAKIALKRLIKALEMHAIVTLQHTQIGGKNFSMTITRPLREPVLYSARSTKRNLEMLAEFAHVSAKMSWQQIREVTGWKSFNT